MPAADEVEISADTAPSKGQMSVLEALKGVLKLALIHDGLARGLREASKALDRRQAHMCVLNEACEEEAYKKLVVALCSEHKIPLIKVPDGKQLGEWAGLCECYYLGERLFSFFFWGGGGERLFGAVFLPDDIGFEILIGKREGVCELCVEYCKSMVCYGKRKSKATRRVPQGGLTSYLYAFLQLGETFD